MTRAHGLVVCWLIGMWLAAGCATTTLFNQDFVEVRTTHFEIVSSFGEEQTRELARALEFYHAGTMRALGLETAVRGLERTRVLAFDDRSLTQPFGMRGADAFFLPTPERGVIVLRTTANWDRRSLAGLRHRYAHRLLRHASPKRYPLWLEEGLAQYAGTLEVRGAQIRIGAPIVRHTTSIRDWQRGSLAQVLQATDLSDYVPSARADFDARSWALVHMLKSGGVDGTAGRQSLQRYIRALNRGTRERPLEALGADPEVLSDRIASYVDRKRFRVEMLRLSGWDPDAFEVLRLSHARARVELAELALSLERLELAQDYFERALDEEPDNARALAGLARTRGDRFELTEPLARRALEEAPADAQVLASVADFYARGARREALDTSERQHRLEQARRLFTRSLQLERDAVAAQLGLARTYLAEGEDVTLGIRWAKAAQQLRPGSLEIDLVLARLEAKQGWLSSARLRTIDMISRTHSIRLRRLGRELVEAIAEMGSR